MAWDFAAVKRGRLDRYTLRRFEDDVVGSRFAGMGDGSLVVALRDDVVMERREEA